ncbi:MAG: hypothetical protein GY786_19460 [Proteobacteria bacterium]|nr:hypothetical protein [Pseudomonadota bacterium]
MKKRRRCQNKDCGVFFTPCPQVPGQTYCSRKVCQQARKNEWNRKKYATDPDYREYKQAARERRKENNPNYWKEYRARRPNYTQNNRDQQQVRNKKRQEHLPEPVIANPDESIPITSIRTGRYKIIPIRPDMIASPDECIVEITAIADG